jgi:hypothetical protein
LDRITYVQLPQQWSQMATFHAHDEKLDNLTMWTGDGIRSIDDVSFVFDGQVQKLPRLERLDGVTANLQCK